MTDNNKDLLNQTYGLLIGVSVNLKDKNVADILSRAADAIKSVLESEKEK